MICTWYTEGTLDDYPTATTVYINIHGFEQYFLIAPIILSCGLSLWTLHRAKNQVSEHQISVTVTILCFTILYVLFNLPNCLAYMTVILDKMFALNLDYTWDSTYYFGYYTTVLSVAINAALNPVLYFWRIAGFRNHVTTIARCRYVGHTASIRPYPSFQNNRTLSDRLNRGGYQRNGSLQIHMPIGRHTMSDPGIPMARNGSYGIPMARNGSVGVCLTVQEPNTSLAEPAEPVL